MANSCMKKLALFASLCVFLLVSCANSSNLPRRIDEFVDQTEASADSMTYEDWELTTQQYEALLEEFAENYDYYTPEERQQVYEAIGRYNGVLVKQGLTEFQIQANQFLDSLNKIVDELPNALEGLIKGFKNGLE